MLATTGTSRALLNGMFRLPHLTEREIHWGFLTWIPPKLTVYADEGLRDWEIVSIQTARRALRLSGETVAGRMGISRSALRKLELNELKMTITLSSLKRAADAMDCDLIYQMRPRRTKSFTKLIWEPILQHARQHHWLNRCVPTRKGPALGMIANGITHDPWFKKQNGWSRQTKRPYIRGRGENRVIRH